MAVIRRITGAEAGGLEQLLSTTGAPSAQSSVVHSGGYAYQIDSAEEINVGFGGDDFGNDYIVGAWIRFNDLTPVTNAQRVMMIGDGSAFPIQLLLATDGDLEIFASGGIAQTITSPSISVDTWHFFELHVEFQSTATGVFELFIDGTSQGQQTGQLTNSGSNTINQVQFGFQPLASSITQYVDDVYLMSGASGASDRLGGCEVIGEYLSTLNSANGDAGDALDIGTWNLVQAIPLPSSVQCEYTATAKAGSVDTDDAGGSAGTGGPNTDSNITGTIAAIQGTWRAERGGGGGTQHYGLLGNSVDGTTRSADLGLAGGVGTYFFISEAGSIVPLSSEYCRIGFEVSGARDFECYGMLAEILHVPAVAGFPYHLRRIKRDNMRTLINL